MLVTHFAVFAPSKSGMYESTKDQIKYERREGLDSRFIDSVRPKGEGQKDGWLVADNWRVALDADVWVVHSGFPLPLIEYIQIPENRAKHIIVSIMHGPVENMLLKEWMCLAKGIDEEGAFTMTHINAIWNHDACVVFDKHQHDISLLFDENEKLVFIPNSIDLENVEKDFKWEYDNRPAIISCDVPRIEKLPVHIIFSMPGVVKRIPTARLNMYGLPLHDIEFFRNIFHRSKGWHLVNGCCENIQMKSNYLAPFIAGADIGFNSNYSGIASRVHMEMMAMGVPVVSYNGDYTKYHAKIFDINSIAEQIDMCWCPITGITRNTMPRYSILIPLRSRLICVGAI
jgi:glycosyltransferase involved in cell wall biosynthesis